MQNVIRKAMTACRNSGQQVFDHFREVTNMASIGSGSRRALADVQMTRFGMYLLAMNGDPDKREIAAAQRYFAIQTYRAEMQLTPATPAEPEPCPQLVRPWGERLSATIQRHRLFIVQNFSAGSFNTYTATLGELLMIEDELLRHQVPIRYGDLPDGSIGRRWSDCCKANGWPAPIGRAPLEMPHLGIEVAPFVYGPELRARFDEWLNQTYIPECMPDYFTKKKEWKDIRLSVASAADHASIRLAGQPAALPDHQRRALEAAGGFVPVTLPPPSR